jgi:hypothetical protein
VMCFGVAVVLIGATLGNDAGVVECWTGAGMVGCDGVDSGKAKDLKCDGGGDGTTFGSGAGTGR